MAGTGRELDAPRAVAREAGLRQGPLHRYSRQPHRGRRECSCYGRHRPEGELQDELHVCFSTD